MKIVEPLAPGITRNGSLSEVICEAHTEFQDLVIGRTDQGVALFSDGERQSTAFSQLIYHEALLVPALLLADRIERVLVIGSGEGVISQLAVSAGAAPVDHVDIDREGSVCAEYLPYGYRWTNYEGRKEVSVRLPCTTATAGALWTDPPCHTTSWWSTYPTSEPRPRSTTGSITPTFTKNAAT
jgi:spermidine synthase